MSLITLFLIFALMTSNVLAQSKILINEFLIDPQPQQVEIINNGTESADLSGSIIDDSGGTTFYTIPQSSVLQPNSCLVFSGDFNLNKTSADTIRLISNAELIDSFSYKTSSGSGISYQRLPDSENNWTTASANLGKFNSHTEQACLIPTITPTVPPTPTETPTPSPISYNNIFISEIMANPESGSNEWVELYNSNDFSVSLNNWLIDDLENNGSSPRMFSLEIPAKSYRLFNLTSSIFNNGGDTVRLLDFNKTLKDDFEYSSSTQGKTWGRIDFSNDNFCLQDPSYESVNNSCLYPTLNPICTGQACLTPTIQTTLKTIDLTIKPRRQNNSYLISPISNQQSNEKILGISSIRKPDNSLLIRTMSFISLSYSLLTIGAILIKMKFIYGKGEKFLSSFIYTGGTQQLPS